ncbi:DUF262 domain-containing protein [Botrimarina mediterranea]|uniref:DUF262 domain-containing protein n=1 Tax=Botrimarina mediterranea TaxID=2528022 RepID=UPI001188E59D|nr:hypothetical protein K2D_16480 [Planctomycetes bacterium K2D]
MASGLLSKKARFSKNGQSVSDESHTDGPKGRFDLIDKRQLVVDPSYQRDLRSSKVQEIVAEFSWAAFGVVLVALRSDGKYYVYDGQHRVMAAMLIEHLSVLPCLVFSFDDLPEEARAFVLTNTKRGAMSAGEKFTARVIANDPDAMMIAGILSRNGLRVATSRGDKSEGAIKCVDAVESTYKRGGGDHLDRVLRIAKRVCRSTMPQKRLVSALSLLDRHLQKTERTSIERSDIVEKLETLGVNELLLAMTRMAEFEGTSNPRTWMAGLIKAINSGKRSRRIEQIAIGE